MMATTQRRTLTITQPLVIKQETISYRSVPHLSSPDQQTAASEFNTSDPLVDHHKAPHANGFHSSTEATDNPSLLLGTKSSRIQQIVEEAASPETLRAVDAILAQVQQLSAAERLLLYLKLPGGRNGVCGSGISDPLRQPVNPLGTRYEIQQTITWIRTHLTEDQDISLPKQDVYEEYLAYCGSNQMKPLSTADFGKVMKQVFPAVRPRRLGTRGNSRYCYAGLCKRMRLEAPILPDLGVDKDQNCSATSQADENLEISTSFVIREWAQKLLGQPFSNLRMLACHLVDKMCVDGRSMAAFSLLSSSSDSNSKHVSPPPSTPTECRTRGTPTHWQRKDKESPVRDNNKRKSLQDHEKSNESSRPASGCKRPRMKNGRSSVESPVRRTEGKKRQTPTVTSPTVATASSPPLAPATASSSGGVAKLPIPRLNNSTTNTSSTNCKGAANYILISPPQPKQRKKYKLIQPKPDPPSTSSEEARFFSDTAATVSDSIPPSSVSIPSLEKDALDDYLHGGNSQEQEEELLLYFQQSAASPPVVSSASTAQQPPAASSSSEEPAKISQLRLLLERNLTKDTAPTQNHTRRRVSFETNTLDPVPPSPNTRRRIFSFTPISPDAAPGPSGQPPPPSPASTQTRNSITSSTNASPFVSPRNTPVPRSRHNSGQQFVFPSGPGRTRHCSNGNQRGSAQLTRPRNFSGTSLTRDYGVGQPLFDESAFPDASSAAESPMLTSTLLPGSTDAGSHQRQRHVSAGPQLHAQIQQPSIDPLGQEVSALLAAEPLPAMPQFRSQSVPLHQMVAGRFMGPLLGDSVAPTPVPSEFTDFLEGDNFDQLAREHLNQLFMDPDDIILEPTRNFSSRSYPNTPIPDLGGPPLAGLAMTENISRSYPSTPIVPDPLMSHLTLNAINQTPTLGAARRNLADLLEQTPSFSVDQTSFANDQAIFASTSVEQSTFAPAQEQPSFLMDDFDQSELTQLVQEVEGSSQMSQESITGM